MLNSSELLQQYQTIHDKLQDEKSKRVYESLYKMKFESLNNEWTGENLILFGTGHWSVYLTRYYRDVCGAHILAFCDNHNKNSTHCEIPVISPEYLSNYQNYTIIIATQRYSQEVKKQLLFMGIPEHKIIDFSFPQKLEASLVDDLHEQYFDEIVKFNDHEVFLDCGVCCGETIQQLLHHVNGKIDGIIGFEPSAKFCEVVEPAFAENKNITIVNAGVGDTPGSLDFLDTGDGAATFVIGNQIAKKTTVPVVKIDDYLKNNGNIAPTFIKMDIEGFEFKALQGARETIQKYKPKLAISVYHKPEDLIEIPSYILELVPEYKLYLRHYMPHFLEETVLYAV